MPEAAAPLLAVNSHYLDKVMGLSQVMEVRATEDIYDARGVKLLAKGALISSALQERLILHKLKKPLETCLAVAGGVDSDYIVAQARRLAEINRPLLQVLCLVGGKDASPFDMLADLRLGNAMNLMLTLVERGGEQALDHAIFVSLIAYTLASKSGMSRDVQTTVMLAGLLHDIGELYIDPELLQAGRRLRPHEWRHIIVHPKISQMLIAEVGNYPPQVAQAAADHHERLNGTGYPRQLRGADFLLPGQVLAVAEMISGVFMVQQRGLERAELALKVIPGEHAPLLVSALSGALQHANDAEAGEFSGSGETIAAARSLRQRIAVTQASAQALADSGQLASRDGLALLRQAAERVAVIERAFAGTGLEDPALLDDSALFSDQGFIFEISVVIREIGWRLRDVARDLSCSSMCLDIHEAASIDRLIDAIDGCDGIDDESDQRTQST
jgi:hypothetical protein